MLSDKLLRGTAKDGKIRVIGADTTELVNKAVKLHNCAPTAAAAYGRMLTSGVLMSSMLKSNNDKLTIKIDGNGIAQGIVVTSYNDAHVKGYIGNPKADLNENSLGKLDVGGIVGKDGYLMVIKDMGLKKPYVGQVPIQTGEIGDDLAYYFAVSEQTPSAVAVGVLVDKDLSIKAAGGFIIQMMPDAEELLADLITYKLQEIPQLSKLLAEGKTIKDVLDIIFEDMDLKILQTMKPEYKCDCSREKVEKALISIGKEELQKIYDDNKDEEIVCQFCNKKYNFTHDDMKQILDKSVK